MLSASVLCGAHRNGLPGRRSDFPGVAAKGRANPNALCCGTAEGAKYNPGLGSTTGGARGPIAGKGKPGCRENHCIHSDECRAQKGKSCDE